MRPEAPMKDKPFLCGGCHRTFATHQGLRDHARAAHRKPVVLYQRMGNTYPEQEESMAQRAVDAALDIAMGEPTDDAWLVEF